MHAVGYASGALSATLTSACGGEPRRSAHVQGCEHERHDPGGHDPGRRHAPGTSLHTHSGPAHNEHAHHAFVDAETLTITLDDPARDAWQRPEDVIAAMALTPTMQVADVGAGTGYFSVRLARALPTGHVIATDIEPNMVHFLSERARREALPNLRAVLSTQSDSGLAPESVDRILVVHVWHHVQDHGAFLRGLVSALRPGGRILIVDFAIDARRGPPPSMRVPPESIIAAFETVGLTASVVPLTLEGQYIVMAQHP